MSVVVCKFGGTSVADAGRIRQVERIVRQDSRRRFVVVSAPGCGPQATRKSLTC